MIVPDVRVHRALALCALCGGLAGVAAPSGAARADPLPTLREALGDPDGLTIGVSIRTRYEAIENQFRPGLAQSSDALLLQTSLHVEQDTGPVRIGGEILDSRAYGGDTGSSLSTSEVDALAITQAYLGFDLGQALGKGSATTFQAGRFTMDIGSRRLVARNRFRNTVNTFSGFRADWKAAGGQSVTAFYTLPVERLPDDQEDILDNHVQMDSQSFALTFWGTHATTPLPISGARLEAYFYALDEEDRPDTATRNRHLRTPGVRLVRLPRPGLIDFDVEGAYQFGNIRASTAATAQQLDVSAYFVHAELGYGSAAGWKPRLAVQLDVASGNKGDGSYNRFDTLYGARRFEFGPSSLFGALGRSNIRSAGGMLEAKPDARTVLATGYRAAWADSTQDSFSTTRVSDSSGEVGHFAGHQIEVRASYWLIPKVCQVEAGGAVLFQGDFLKNASSANGYGDPRFAYFSTIVNF